MTLSARGTHAIVGTAALADDDPWEEPDLPAPEAGGAETPPADPDARDLPQSVPDETYVGLLDASGVEIAGAGYSRTPVAASGWAYDPETGVLTNDADITGPTPSESWPAVASVAVFPSAGFPTPIVTAPIGPGPIAPTPGVPVVLERNIVSALPPADPILRHVSEEMPAPTLVNGRPVGWEPAQAVSAKWGRLQITVEGEDITYLLDAATPFPTISEVEPFGWATASIRLPQLTTFHELGSGDLDWCRQGANVRIRVKRFASQGGGYVDLFRGFIESPVIAGPGGVTLECTGMLFQADKTICPPVLSPRVRDSGRVIADLLNAVPGRRYSRMTRRNTGIKTLSAGSWEPVLTGSVQQLLATMLDSQGRQWTVMPDGREPVLRKKNLTTIAWSVRSGQRGITVNLEREMTPNAIYGEGVTEGGGYWRNAKYPNWDPDATPDFPLDPDEYFTVGTRDSDTSSGSGVSDWQDKAGRPVTGTYSRADANACRDLQREAGIQVDGTVGPQTWAATFATGSNTGTLDGAFIAPLVATPAVAPRRYGPDGDDLGPNPKYDPDVIRVEDVVAFGQGVTRSEARTWVRRSMSKAVAQGRSPHAYTGTVTFELDPPEGHRLEVVRAGTNGVIRDVSGEDVQVHVSHVSMRPGGANGIIVTATVDTEARDYPTLDAIRTRERNAVDPAKAFIKRRGSQDAMTSRATFDSESPAGRLPKHALFANLWTVVQVPFGDYGRIVRTSIRTTDSASPFALAVFSKPITAAKLLAVVGNPLTAEQNPWQDEADELEGLGLLMAWGWAKQPAGYYPKALHTPDGETAAPVTGRLVDDSAWEYASQRSPWVWVASIASSGCQIRGRFYHGAQ